MCGLTVNTRVKEFERTPSAALTLEQFNTVELESEADPPVFTRNRIREVSTNETLLHWEKLRANQFCDRHVHGPFKRTTHSYWRAVRWMIQRKANTPPCGGKAAANRRTERSTSLCITKSKRSSAKTLQPFRPTLKKHQGPRKTANRLILLRGQATH